MGWESQRVLEGIFQFGAPLNIWKMELDLDRYGDRPKFVIHMQIDDDESIANQLNQKIRSDQKWPRLIIMEGPERRSISTTNWREWIFYQPYLYSLQKAYSPSQYPYDVWKGWTLGIAFDKSAANKASVRGLFVNETGKLFF